MFHHTRISMLTRKRFFSTIINSCLEQLQERALIRVQGADSSDFLQGLTTNDVNSLDAGQSIFTLFLNSKGRIVQDSLIYKINKDELLVECNESEATKFIKYLKVFILRKKVSVLPEERMKIWACYGQKDNVHLKELQQSFPQAICVIDPRLKDIGIRILSDSNLTTESTDSNAYMSYREHLYKLGIGEGSVDFPQGEVLATESNCDYLNGISFQKGCYLGQEVTARAFHTGVIRKRIVPITITQKGADKVESNDPVFSQTVRVGTLRNCAGNIGLASLRLPDSIGVQLKVKDYLISAETPYWWPENDLLKKQK